MTRALREEPLHGLEAERHGVADELRIVVRGYVEPLWATASDAAESAMLRHPESEGR